MDNDAFKLFIAIGTCHCRLKEHAQEIRKHSSVTSVTCWLDAYDFDNACRFEDYVDAEISNGEAISWRLEITLTLDEFIVEADVRKIHAAGYDVVAEVADRTYSTAAECAIGILEVTRQLIVVDPHLD